MLPISGRIGFTQCSKVNGNSLKATPHHGELRVPREAGWELVRRGVLLPAGVSQQRHADVPQQRQRLPRPLLRRVAVGRRACGGRWNAVPTVAGPPCMRAAQCTVWPPFHRRPPAAKLAAPHAGGSRSVATAAKMAAPHAEKPRHLWMSTNAMIECSKCRSETNPDAIVGCMSNKKACMMPQSDTTRQLSGWKM